MNSVELLMNVTPNETRVALVETGVLKEVHIERQAKRGIVGNIYKGRVTRVLPGMQSAFCGYRFRKSGIFACFRHCFTYRMCGCERAKAIPSKKHF